MSVRRPSRPRRRRHRRCPPHQTVRYLLLMQVSQPPPLVVVVGQARRRRGARQPRRRPPLPLPAVRQRSVCVDVRGGVNGLRRLPTRRSLHRHGVGRGDGGGRATLAGSGHRRPALQRRLTRLLGRHQQRVAARRAGMIVLLQITSPQCTHSVSRQRPLAERERR
jgi:hypothetical protein